MTFFENLNIKKEKFSINISYVFQVKITVNGPKNEYLEVVAYDEEIEETRLIIYSGSTVNLPWYNFKKWTLKFFNNEGNLVYEEKFDPTGKKVLIDLGSSALGDTIAWMPYAQEFARKHNCKVVLSTFRNNLFNQEEWDHEWIEPGQVVYDLYAAYRIGWHYRDRGNSQSTKLDKYTSKEDLRKYPLQYTSSRILGLDYKEVKPKIKKTNLGRPIQEKYVVIAINSTTQAKYWNNPIGWQMVVDFLNKEGFTVILGSMEEDGFRGNKHPNGIIRQKNYQMDTTINYLEHCEFFIGISSGLTWLSWAIGKPTICISGITSPITEPSGIININTEEGKCKNCANKFRIGGWDWCPEHLGTERQYECSKSISHEKVIEKIKKLI